MIKQFKQNYLAGGSMAKSSKTLNKEDKQIIHALEPVIDGIAELFGSNCEVVLHCVEDISHSVTKIVNGHVTGRKVGAPLTDFGIELLNNADSLGKDVTDSYFVKQDDGRLLKSVAILIRNDKGKPIGFVCINVDLSLPLLSCVKESLSHDSRPPLSVIEHFSLTVEELVSQTFETVMTRMGNQRGMAPSEKNKAAVRELCKRGIFKVTGAIDIAAKLMGISRYTVYNYIREAKLE